MPDLVQDRINQLLEQAASAQDTWIVLVTLAVLFLLGWFGKDIVESMNAFCNKLLSLDEGYNTDEQIRRG